MVFQFGWALPKFISGISICWALQPKYLKAPTYCMPDAILTLPAIIIVSLTAWVIYLAVC